MENSLPVASRELDSLAATKVQLSAEVVRTPEDIVQRYRECRNWKLYPKEWIFRNLLKQGASVLDFGSGTGEFTTQLAMLGAEKVYSMDVTPGLIEVTRRRAELDGVINRVELICDFIQNVEPRPVDLVIAYAVLHHCHPLRGIVPQLMRWVKPGGTFVCVEPVVFYPWLEHLRENSGVPFEALDEGERKLDASDVRYVRGALQDPHIEHFRLLARLDRWLPHEPLARLDRMFLSVPGISRFSGTALIHGKSTASVPSGSSDLEALRQGIAETSAAPQLNTRTR